MELYQRVWAEQFTLTDEQKADIMAGKLVYWQDAYVRQNGPTRFHVLLHIVDMDKPVYENQWLVKADGQTKILWDHEVKSTYLFSSPVATEEAPQPIQSEALKRFLARNKSEAKLPEAPPAAPVETISEPVAETPVEEPVLPEIVAEEPRSVPVEDPAPVATEEAKEDNTFAYPDYKPTILSQPAEEPTAVQAAAEIQPAQSNGQEAHAE